MSTVEKIFHPKPFSFPRFFYFFAFSLTFSLMLVSLCPFALRSSLTVPTSPANRAHLPQLQEEEGRWRWRSNYCSQSIARLWQSLQPQKSPEFPFLQIQLSLLALRPLSSSPPGMHTYLVAAAAAIVTTVEVASIATHLVAVSQDSLARAVVDEMQKIYRHELGPQPVPLTVPGEVVDVEEVSF